MSQWGAGPRGVREAPLGRVEARAVHGGRAMPTDRLTHRVLVAIEDAMLRRRVARAIERAGISVHSVRDAGSLAAAVAALLARGSVPELIVGELTLPAPGMLSVLQAIDRHTDRPVPAILWPGMGAPLTRRDTTLLELPIDLEQLGTRAAGIVWHAACSPRLDMPNPSTHPKIIIAEDQPAMRELVARRLREVGFDVVEVSSGDTLWRELLMSSQDDDNPREADLIVSDVRMPGRSGLEVLAELRQTRRELPVILMTAFGDADTHATAARLGARVFSKPFDVGELVEAAMALVDPRERR